MKVVPKAESRIHDRMLNDIHALRVQGQEVSHIVLTHPEYAELRNDLRVFHAMGFGAVGAEVGESEVREFAPQHGARERAIRVISCGKFHGFPLFVVPEGYCPV